MALAPLPNAWNLYNLRSSPFFQGTLEFGDNSLRPLSLFVGRHVELKQLGDAVRRAGSNPTRHAIAGAPGVGKTTLVQELKLKLREDHYLGTTNHVQVLPEDTPESLFGRILADIYETMLVNRRGTADAECMKAAQALIRVMRLGSGGGNLSILGSGVGFTKGAATSVPKDLMLDGPRVLSDILGVLHTADARGLILHLNNLENLSDGEADRAADVIRSLRDVVFQRDFLHVLIVGTTEAVNAAINTHAQVRTVFSTVIIDALAIDDVHHLLRERYRFLRLDPKQAAAPPVTDEAVGALYHLFRGDLRGLLKALDDGIGQAAAFGVSGGKKARRDTWAPMTLPDILPALQRTYQAHLASLSESKRVGHLTVWGRRDPAMHHTQASLQKLWKVSQPAVSSTLGYLTRQGYVVALPRDGKEATQYVLSGVSRLVFG